MHQDGICSATTASFPARPADDPVIAVAAIGEHACHGSSGASPIVFAVIKQYLEKYYPDRFGPEAIKARIKKGGIATTLPTSTRAEDEDVALGDVVDQPRARTEDLLPKPEKGETE